MKPNALSSGVKPTGDFAVFQVRSLSRGDLWHRVDLEMVECECEQWKFKVQQIITKDDYCPFDRLCKHLQRAFAYVGWVAVEKATQQRQNVNVKPAYPKGRWT